MNVYDFDKTIINDDSSKLFLQYCFEIMPRVFLKKPWEKVSSLMAYIRERETVEAFKESMFAFLRYVPDPGRLVQEFWDKNMWRIEDYYKELRRNDDLIISASPEFLVRPAAERLGAQVIATDMSLYSGKISGINCRGEEKVRRFRIDFPDAYVESFYSDSLSDQPMAEIAEQAFLIVDHQPQPWPFK